MLGSYGSRTHATPTKASVARSIAEVTPSAKPEANPDLEILTSVWPNVTRIKAVGGTSAYRQKATTVETKAIDRSGDRRDRDRFVPVVASAAAP